MAVASGSVQLRALAARLETAGAGLWLRQMTAEMRGIVRADLVPAAQESAQRRLPRRGGLNERVANERITVSVLTGARRAGVQMSTRAPSTEQTNKGFVRHPTRGGPGFSIALRGKGQWKTEPIPEAAGWWDDALREHSPIVTPALIGVMERVGREIQGRGI